MESSRAFDPVRALGTSWTLMMRAPLTLILGGILLAVTDTGNAFQWRMSDWDDYDSAEAFLAGGVGALGCCLAVVTFVVNSLLQVGFAGAIQRVMVTGTDRFGDLLKERGLWLSMVLARLLKHGVVLFSFLPLVFLIGGPGLLGAALDLEPLGWGAGALLGLAYVPIWFYIILGLCLVEQAVAVESKDPVAALQRSWEVAQGNRLQLLVFLAVTVVVELAGIFLCCIGVLFTSAWSYVAWYEAYLRFALPQPSEEMWIDRRPPTEAR